MARTYRKTTGRKTEQDRHLRVTTRDRLHPDLDLLGRIIVDLAMAELAPARSPALSGDQLRVTPTHGR